MALTDENIYYRISAEDDMIIVKVFVRQTNELLNIPPIPDTFREALKDIDNHLKLKVVLGIDAEDILRSEK